MLLIITVNTSLAGLENRQIILPIRGAFTMPNAMVRVITICLIKVRILKLEIYKRGWCFIEFQEYQDDKQYIDEN